MKNILLNKLSVLNEGCYFDRDKQSIVSVFKPLTFTLDFIQGSVEASHSNLINHIKMKRGVIQATLNHITIIPSNIFTCYWYFNIESSKMVSVETFLKSENTEVNQWFAYINREI